MKLDVDLSISAIVVAVQALSAATGARPSLDTKAFSHGEPFSTSHPFQQQPRLITQPEPFVSQGSYGATVHAPSPSRLHRYDRARVQKQLDFDSNGNWTTQKSMRPGQSEGLLQLAFMPFEGARRWNSTREAAGFSGLHLLLVGSSPISQLAIDFPRLHGGAFDEYQCPFRGGATILRRIRHVVERASIRSNVRRSAATRQLAADAMIVFVAAVAKPSVVAVAVILCSITPLPALS